MPILLNGARATITSLARMTTRSLFVQNARTLEKLKTSEIPSDIYQNAKYIVFQKDSDSILIDKATKKIAWKTQKDLSALDESGGSLKVLLDVVGQNPETCLFAVELPQPPPSLLPDFCNARKAIFLLDEKESALVSQARGLITFCHTTNFCKTCGGSLTLRPAGTQKECDGCKRTHYPTLSPVGIVLIENEAHSKVLLVRGSRHPQGMYSCVAGFIEPGESLEGNIRREIAEEVGLDVGRVEYCASQHWAMPDSQLMLGAIATATTEEFEVDPVELESGQWCEADVLRDAVDRAKRPSAANMDPAVLWVPPPSAVAHTLMEAWLVKYHSYIPPVKSNI